MNIPKKTCFIIAASLAGIALMASCSKHPEAKKGKKGEKASAVAKTNDIFPVGKSSLNVVRKGQYVTLTWHADVVGAKIKKIYISRSATGKVNNRKTVAMLEASLSSYVDCLPDENAHWYWVRVIMDDGRVQEIGPVRVDVDKAGAVSYIKLEHKYKINIIRTDDLATIKWDFPDDEYELIKINRAPRPVDGPFNMTGKAGGVASVVTTVEKKSQHTDALPDPNSEYWYWFRITLKSGTIVDRGPIKAEYVNQ